MVVIPGKAERVRAVFMDLWADMVGWLAVGALFIALLTVLGSRFAVIDALNQAAPLLFAVTLVIALLSLTVRNAAPLIVALAWASAAVTGGRVIPDLVAATGQQLLPADAAPVDRRVRVVTFNMHGFMMTDSGPMVAWLLDTDPDYILLQEAGGDAWAQASDGLSQRWPYRVECALPSCLSVILTKQAPLQPGPSDTPWASAVFAAPAGAGTIAMMAAHTAWPLDRPIDLAAPRATSQPAQYARIASQVRALGAERTILAGDFNSSGWSHGLNRLSASAGLRRHSQALFSWPAHPVWKGQPKVPVVAIDHVMAGSQWQLHSIARGPALGSDHFPIVADLVWTGADSDGVQPNVEAGRRMGQSP